MHNGQDDTPPKGPQPSGPWADVGTLAEHEGAEAKRRSVQLRREFKGLTVTDLLADRGLDEELPGRVLTALRALERGDLAAADGALPGRFGKLLDGPSRRRRRRRLVRWIVACALAAAAASATILCLERP